MIAWLLKFAIGSKLKQTMASPMALGAIILSLLVLWYYLFNHLPVVHQRNAAVKEKTLAIKALNDYKAEQTRISNAAIIENALKLEQARSAASLAEVVAQNQIAAIESTSQKTQAEIAENLRSEYENKLNSMPFTYSVLPQTIGDSNREAETASAASELAESERIANPACVGLRDKLETLEEGCALTTVYFNQCRALLDADALVCERAE